MNVTDLIETRETAKVILTFCDCLAIGADILVSVILSLSRISATTSNAILLNSQCADIVEGVLRLTTKFLHLSPWASEVMLNVRVSLSSARIFFMTLLAVNLYFAVVRSADYKNIFTWGLSLGLLVGMWVLNGVVFGVSTLLSSLLLEDATVKYRAYYAVVLAAIFLVKALPLAVTSLVYWRMVQFRRTMLVGGHVQLNENAMTREMLSRAMFRFAVLGGSIALLVFLDRYILQITDVSLEGSCQLCLAFTVSIHGLQYALVLGKVYIMWTYFPPFRQVILDRQRRSCCQHQVVPEPEVEVCVIGGDLQPRQEVTSHESAVILVEEGRKGVAEQQTQSRQQGASEATPGNRSIK